MTDHKRAIEIAARTIEQSFIGVLSTVDAEHRPRSRHMVAVASDETLQRLYCLTASGTRKVSELRDNPAVCWLFADRDYQHIVRLGGKAHLTSTSDLPVSIWHRLIDTTDNYVATDLREKQHFAFHVVITEVETLELLSPQLDLLTPETINLDEARPERDR